MENRPRATVFSADTPELSIRDAMTKSIQGARKELMTVYTTMGLDRGMMIFQNTVNSLAPSR